MNIVLLSIYLNLLFLSSVFKNFPHTNLLHDFSRFIPRCGYFLVVILLIFCLL